MKEKSQKKSFDCPDTLYAEIMEYAVKNKFFKFGPALLDLLRKGLDSK